MPAAATLIQVNSGELPRGLLLVPDLGTVPVASYRPVLRGLIELSHAADASAKDETLLCVGVAGATAESSARIAAWHVLLQQVAQRSGADPLRARVFAWPQGLANGGDRGQRLGTQAEQVFALVARHPLLTYRQLATLLGTFAGRIGQLVAQLTGRDWLRALAPGDVPHDALAFSSHQRRHTLVELSPAGRREAARRLLLPTAVGTKHHGLLGKATTCRRFLRQFAHTLGANAIFVTFVLAARQVTQRGGDEALEEWRSAAACTRGRFRPDGYGCHRRAAARFDSSWSSTAERNDRTSTPPGSPATTAIATRAPLPVTMRAFPLYWSWPRLKVPRRASHVNFTSPSSATAVPRYRPFSRLPIGSRTTRTVCSGLSGAVHNRGQDSMVPRGCSGYLVVLGVRDLAGCVPGNDDDHLGVYICRVVSRVRTGRSRRSPLPVLGVLNYVPHLYSIARDLLRRCGGMSASEYLPLRVEHGLRW
jgi:hypothetical protein